MIDPTQAASFPAATAPSGDATPVPPAPAVAPVAQPSRAGRESAPQRDPVSLSVDRDATGVFVYTLTDSSSGRVLAVIPRSAVLPTSQQEVDIQA